MTATHERSRQRGDPVPLPHTYRSGVVLLLLAALLWSLNGVLIKLVYDAGKGPHGVVIAFYRSLFAGLFLLPLARGKWSTLRRHCYDKDGKPRRRSLRPAAACCVVFFTLMTVCFVVANTKTEAANAIILQYTSTFWIFGLSPWVLREYPRTSDLWILALVVVGIAIIFFGEAETDMFGLVNALAAGLFYGLLTLMIRRMRDADPAAITVLNNLGSAGLILPLALGMGVLRVSPHALGLLAVMGLVQFGIPYYLYTLGLARVPAYHASLLTLVEPVLVPVWTFLVIGEAVPMGTLLGGGVILFSLVLFLLSTRRTSPGLARAVHDAPGPPAG